MRVHGPDPAGLATSAASRPWQSTRTGSKHATTTTTTTTTTNADRGHSTLSSFIRAHRTEAPAHAAVTCGSEEP